MSRRVLFVIRDLALDPNRAESRFKRPTNRASQFSDSENLRGSLEKISGDFHKAPCDYSGERRLPACIRRQLADEIVFNKLPALPGEDCFAETPKSARETHALPGIIAREIIRRIIRSARSPAALAQACDTLLASPPAPAECA